MKLIINLKDTAKMGRIEELTETLRDMQQDDNGTPGFPDVIKSITCDKEVK